jgi:hypothetical protein
MTVPNPACDCAKDEYLHRKYAVRNRAKDPETISFIEISIEAGILLGGKHEACFVLGVAGIEPMPS